MEMNCRALSHTRCCSSLQTWPESSDPDRRTYSRLLTVLMPLIGYQAAKTSLIRP